MTKFEAVREFSKSMGFITQQSTCYLLGCSKNYATAVIGQLKKQDTKFHRMKSSEKIAVYGYGEKKTPRYPHDFLENCVAAKHWCNFDHWPNNQPYKKNEKNADFKDWKADKDNSIPVYWEVDRGTEGSEGKRGIFEKLQKHYSDGSTVIFVCTTIFSNKKENEQRRCDQILDWVDEYRTKHPQTHLNVYVIPMTAYLNGDDNRPVSRKRNGQTVRDIII
ncbi:MAG: hypothetical protein AB9866_18835 [Syntrophobacteraceae bacterium]